MPNQIQKNATKLENVEKQLTHLKMNDKYIQSIGNLSPYKNLQVLYLHNNAIERITNLEELVNLTHLYLQRNRIRKLEGLPTLKQLRKLYIGHNEISVVEGLEQLNYLEELHVEKQQLKNGDRLCFDLRSIIGIQHSLQVLNISCNRLQDGSLYALKPLRVLRVLNAAYNEITDVNQVVDVICKWTELIDADFTGNPMVKQHRYRDTVIANTLHLRMMHIQGDKPKVQLVIVVLDNKDINEITESFVKQFERQQRSSASTIKKKIGVKSSKSVKIIDVIPSLSALSLVTPDYIPWQVFQSHKSQSAVTIPPLFIKQQQQYQSRKCDRNRDQNQNQNRKGTSPGTKKVSFAL